MNPLDKKHRGSIWWITILIAGLLLLLCSGMILRGISSIAQLFHTFLLGIMIAFVLDQPSKLIQNALSKKANWREKPAKAVGILGAYLFIFALLAAVVGIVIPQLIDSVRTFALNMDAYLNNLQQELDRITIPLGVQRIDLSNLIDLAHAGLGKMDAAVVPHILSVTGTMLQALGTLAIGIAFSVYLLAGKERILSQGNRVLRAYLPEQTYEQTHSVVRVIVDCFRNYLIGQTTEAVILGSLCRHADTWIGIRRCSQCYGRRHGDDSYFGRVYRRCGCRDLAVYDCTVEGACFSDFLCHFAAGGKQCHLSARGWRKIGTAGYLGAAGDYRRRTNRRRGRHAARCAHYNCFVHPAPKQCAQQRKQKKFPLRELFFALNLFETALTLRSCDECSARHGLSAGWRC